MKAEVIIQRQLCSDWVWNSNASNQSLMRAAATSVSHFLSLFSHLSSHRIISGVSSGENSLSGVSKMTKEAANTTKKWTQLNLLFSFFLSLQNTPAVCDIRQVLLMFWLICYNVMYWYFTWCFLLEEVRLHHFSGNLQ